MSGRGPAGPPPVVGVEAAPAGAAAPVVGTGPAPARAAARAGGPEAPRATRLLQLGAALLAVAAVVSLLASPRPAVSLPWVILVGLGAAVVLWLTSPAGARVAGRFGPRGQVILGLATGALVLLIVLTGTRWPAYKLSFLSGLYAALPSWSSLPWPSLARGISPNQAGAMLAGFAAYALAVAVAPGGWTTRRPPVVRATAAMLALTETWVVFMTGSRAALAGIGVAVTLTLVVRDRRWLWPAAAALGAAAAAFVAQPTLLGRMVDMVIRDESIETKLLARLDIWFAALRGIEDHPVTGIGLGVLNDVLPVRYPYETVGLSYTVTHAHNVFLDIALTMGLLGLVGFGLLLAGAASTAGHAIHSARVKSGPMSWDVWAATSAAVSGMTVFVIFGMTDALSVSTIAGVFLWVWPSLLALTSHYTSDGRT